uniref:Bax inhibitor 1 n=1 Tax=Hanusia phi TaxID=3032 RepID=A0A7S0E806_9CRYP
MMGAQGAGGMGGMRNMDWNSIGKMDQLTPQVQRHLTKVYAALSGALLAAVLGAYYGWKFAVTGVWTQIALFGCILGLSMIRDVYNRLIVFHAAGFLMGCNLSPLLAMVALHNPQLIVTALMGTAMIFICFSLSAMYAKRRHFLYLGGMLSSAISILCTFRFLNFIMGGTMSAGLYEIELYGGLFMFMAYVIFDTQMIIEDAYANRKDFVAHAMELLIDFVAIFVRLLVILTRNAEKKREDERRKESR